jgi:hypothetical protein
MERKITRMRVSEFAQRNNMKILSGIGNIDGIISGVYAGDLLSWVMSHAKKGDAWITVHTHLNIVAVAVLTEVSCIIIPEDIKVEQATLDKADEQGVVILSTHLSTYAICCRAYESSLGR